MGKVLRTDGQNVLSLPGAQTRTAITLLVSGSISARDTAAYQLVVGHSGPVHTFRKAAHSRSIVTSPHRCSVSEIFKAPMSRHYWPYRCLGGKDTCPQAAFRGPQGPLEQMPSAFVSLPGQTDFSVLLSGFWCLSIHFCYFSYSPCFLMQAIYTLKTATEILLNYLQKPGNMKNTA